MYIAPGKHFFIQYTIQAHILKLMIGMYKVSKILNWHQLIFVGLVV